MSDTSFIPKVNSLNDVNILGYNLYSSSDWVNSFRACNLPFFLYLHEVYALCVSKSISFTYVTEMIVCHAIYPSVINVI